MILSAAISMAVPAQAVEREPNVPVPIMIWSVSPNRNAMRDGSTPNFPAMIWRNVV
jgi:hypothetical protein